MAGAGQRRSAQFSRGAALLCWLLACVLLAACHAAPTLERFAAGLHQPRGMVFDAAGNLFVAEAGLVDAAADTRSAPIISHSSRVLRISPQGQLTPVLTGLPFTNYRTAGDVGAADVVLLDETLYVLTGEGYDDQLSRSVLRATTSGEPERVASIMQFVERITPLDSAMGIATLASNPFAMIGAADGQSLLVTDGASGRVFQVTTDGEVRVLVEVPGKPPLTGLTLGPDGRVYLAVFSALPLAPGNGAIWAVDSAGHTEVVAAQLTMPIDVSFDHAGNLYVLEFSDGLNSNELYASGGGRLLRITPDGTPTVVLAALNYPTAIAFASTGDLYLAVDGAFGTPGRGAILKLPCAELGVVGGCVATGQR